MSGACPLSFFGASTGNALLDTYHAITSPHPNPAGESDPAHPRCVRRQNGPMTDSVPGAGTPSLRTDGDATLP